MTPKIGWIEYAVIAGYLVALVGVGFVFRRFNANASDYFKNGCRGTWWLIGASAFMQLFSAWTFVGAAGAAFEGGWSVMWIFAANAVAFFLVFLFLGPWFRQLRATTSPEIIRLRFGPATQQAYAWLQGLHNVLMAALWLWGLSTFTAAVFDFKPLADAVDLSEVQLVIVVTGVIVVAYSVAGGSWAVTATDFVQSLILLPLTLLVAFLCIRYVGGLDGLFGQIHTQGLTERFALVKSPDEFPLGKYGFWWVVAVMVYKPVVYGTLVTAQRYFGVKDGREARKAGLLACCLMLGGMLVWFIPPVVARLTMADEVLATEMNKPAEAAYALMAIKVLPVGMTGLMVVAMLAATMSSMDSGLNRNAAVFVRDIQPLFLRLFGRNQLDERQQMFAGKLASVALGVIIIALSMYFAGANGKGVFEYMLNIGVIVGVPMSVPMMLALFIRRVPSWAALLSIGAAAIPAVFGEFFAGGDLVRSALPNAEGTLLGAVALHEWSYQAKFFINAGVGAGVFFATMPFWRTASHAYRERVDEFFVRMHTPVDFEKEVGQPNDAGQLRIIGGFSVVMGLLICLLLLVPGNGLDGRLAILFVGGTVAGVGALLCWAGFRRGRAEARVAARTPDQADELSPSRVRRADAQNEYPAAEIAGGGEGASR